MNLTSAKQVARNTGLLLVANRESFLRVALETSEFLKAQYHFLTYGAEPFLRSRQL
jgi:hypothetical protein